MAVNELQHAPDVYSRLEENPVWDEFLSFDWLAAGDAIDYAARQRPGQFEHFVRDIVHVARPAPYQLEIGELLLREHRVAEHGPHGIGKTTTAALVVLYMLWAFPPNLKIILTASTWPQLTDYLWPEINLWAKRVNWNEQGMQLRYGRELLEQQIKMPAVNKYVFSKSPRTHEYIEGAHADTILYVFDEAKIIPDDIWDAAEGAFASGDAYALALSTPGDTLGRFYAICNHEAGYEDWSVRHVTKDEAITAGRMTAAWAEARRQQWAIKRPDLYHNRVLGMFYQSAEDALIPGHWVALANRRWLELKASGELKKMADANVVLGVDVAEEGNDLSAICKLTGRVVQYIETYARAEIMETTGYVALHARQNRMTPIGVDAIGVGAGVPSRLKELGYRKVVKIKGSRSKGLRLVSDDGNEFVNLRSYVWWLLREALDPEGEDPLALPPDDDLFQQITAPKWKPNSKGVIEVMRKEDIKVKLNGKSPDKGESVIYALYTQRVATRARRGLRIV